MSATTDQIIADAAKLHTDTGLLHDIVHGSDTSVVTTEGGDVSTASKVIKDMEDLIASEVESLSTAVTSAEASASTATTKASQASTSASTATTQAGIATTKASEASASASTATTQAGISTTKASEASASASSASISASTATTQAGIATTQAGIATTKASEASASEANAATSEANAAISANQADNHDTSAYNWASAASFNADRAEDEKDAAAASATIADARATAAFNSASYAADSQVAAADSAANAAADRIQTGADRVQTGLDRIQTGLDRAAASGSAAAASGSQSAAAASAALAAAIANYTTFKGTVASVPATSTAAGDLYLVSAAHTAQSITWAINDIAIYNGTSGSWSRVPGAIWMGMSASLRNALAPRGGLAFDGSANSRVQGPMQNMQADDFSVTVAFKCPATNPSALLPLFTLSDNAGILAAQQNLYARFYTNGTLVFQAFKSSTSVVYGVGTVDSVIAAYGGKDVVVTFVKAAAGWQVYINGSSVALAAPSASGGGTAGMSLDTLFFTLGRDDQATRVFTNIIRSATAYNLALSAADVLEIYELGGEVPERFKFGSQADKKSVTALYSYWFGTGGITGVTSNAFTVNAGSSGMAVRATVAQTDMVFGLGPNRRVRISLTVDAGVSGLVSLGNYSNRVTAALVAGTNEYVLDSTIGSSLYFESLASVAGGTVTINSAKQIGAVAHYRCTDNTSLTVRDSSTNALHAQRTTGVTPVLAFDHEAFRDVAMPYTASKQPAKYHLSDGATSNRGLVQGPFVAGSRGWLAGAPLATWRGRLPVPSANPSSDIVIFSAQSVNNAMPWAATTSIEAHISSAGMLEIATWAPSANWRSFRYPGFRAAYSGQTQDLEIKFTKGTANPVVLFGNVDISAAFSVVTNGASVPEWLDVGLTTTFHLTGYAWPSGELPSGAWINGHLTSAESLAWMITGQPPAWVQAGGTFNVSNGAFTNVAYESFTGASATGFSAQETGSGVSYAISTLPFRPVIGQIVRVTFDAVLTSGNIPSIAVGEGGVGIRSAATNIAAGANVIDILVTGSNANQVQFGTGANAQYSVSNFKIASVSGALSLLTPQAIPVAHDWTGIGGNDARCVGVRGVTEDPNWIITTDTTSAAAGGQAALGGDILDSTRDVIDSIVQLPTVGTPTTSIGHSTLWLATYVPTGSLSSGINPRPLAVRKLESNQVWIYQSTTDRLRTTIKGHRAN